MKLSFNKDTTQVLLIGTKEYEKLSSIDLAENNIKDLYQIFADKNIIGIDPSNIHIINASSKDTDRKSTRLNSSH